MAGITMKRTAEWFWFGCKYGVASLPVLIALMLLVGAAFLAMFTSVPIM